MPCVIMMVALALAAEPWNQPYTGDDATGGDVIALWSFEGDNPAADASGGGHLLLLRGQSRITDDGRFGKGLECFNVPAGEDKPEGAVTQKKHSDLSPRGAFTVEASFKLKPEAPGTEFIFLVDNKYYHYRKPDLPNANTGYMLFFAWDKDTKSWVITSMFGFGDDSAVMRSEPVAIDPGQWRHIALTYDGDGAAKLYLDGEMIKSQRFNGRGAITPSEYQMVVGGRIGSSYSGFPGVIDQVRISTGALEFEPAP